MDEKTFTVKAIAPVARVSRLTLNVKKPGPKAWAIEEARKAGAACARQRHNMLDWGCEGDCMPEARKAFEVEIGWAHAVLVPRVHRTIEIELAQKRTQALMVDAFCDAYDAELDRIYEESER